MAINEIELQVGQVWRTRGGEEVVLTRDLGPGTPYRFVDEDDYTYSAGGLYLLNEEGKGDLVAPISGPGIDSAEPRRPSPAPVLVPPPATPQHSHYFIPVPSGLTQMDVYRLCLLAGVTDPCAQHILKKVLRPGQRGAKTERQDWENIRDTAVRRLAMMDEDGVA